MQKAVGRGKYDRAQSTVVRAVLRREKLLDDATEVFAARGLAGTRVDDIIEYAGVSRRTLYKHFESVDAILTEIYDRAVRISFTTIAQRLVDVRDPIERIFSAVAAYYEIITSNPSAARVVFDVYRHAGPTHIERFEQSSTQFVMLMIESLNAAYAAGRLARRPDETSAYALIKAVEAVAVRALHRGEHANLPALAPIMATLIIDAFRGAPVA